MLVITQAKYIKDYCVWIRFNDGAEGEVNLAEHLNGSVFEPLKNQSVFSRLKLDTNTDTISWPNGADMAPEFLRTLLN